MIVIGYILLFLGFLAWLSGELMFLTAAYKQSLGWFLGCLFIPLVSFIFLFMHLRQTIRPFGVAVAGLVVALVGGSMAGVQWE